MSDGIERMLQFLLSVLGIIPLPDLATLDLAALSLAVALVAIATLVFHTSLAGVGTGQGSTPHPLRGIDPSALLAQSDPDAAGHPRPRAPGVARAV